MNFINYNKNNQLTLLFSLLKKTIISQIKTFIGGTENDDIDF